MHYMKRLRNAALTKTTKIDDIRQSPNQPSHALILQREHLYDTLPYIDLTAEYHAQQAVHDHDVLNKQLD